MSTAPAAPDTGAATPTETSMNSKDMRRILASSLIGSTIEYYDFIGASLLGAVLAYPILVLMSNGELRGFALAIILGNGLVQGFLHGPIAAYVAEHFPTRNRYTGASLAYQGASMIGAGFTPMIVAGLSLAAGGGLWLIAVFWIATLLASAVAVRATPEGIERELD
ncbi:hypothetical protein ACFRJ9_19535 [Paenarthrobacter sp. NPDC056912]|uniref:hypothetical protein n=1 Tax=Paenarthrobacter sp. NPDC056912 TaxID=3345965 RepID=UPI00366C51DB